VAPAAARDLSVGRVENAHWSGHQGRASEVPRQLSQRQPNKFHVQKVAILLARNGENDHKTFSCTIKYAIEVPLFTKVVALDSQIDPDWRGAGVLSGVTSRGVSVGAHSWCSEHHSPSLLDTLSHRYVRFLRHQFLPLD
jgi:hypothetical protein